MRYTRFMTLVLAAMLMSATSGFAQSAQQPGLKELGMPITILDTDGNPVTQ